MAKIVAVDMQKLPPKSVRLYEAVGRLKSTGRVTSVRAFATSLGKSYSHMSSVLNGSREVTEKLADEIEKVHGISKPWLLLGVGEMFKTETAPVDNGAIMNMLVKMSGDMALIKEKLGITTPT